MNILDHFTSIDDLLVSLLERIGGVTEITADLTTQTNVMFVWR